MSCFLGRSKHKAVCSLLYTFNKPSNFQPFIFFHFVSLKIVHFIIGRNSKLDRTLEELQSWKRWTGQKNQHLQKGHLRTHQPNTQSNHIPEHSTQARRCHRPSKWRQCRNNGRWESSIRWGGSSSRWRSCLSTTRSYHTRSHCWRIQHRKHSFFNIKIVGAEAI